MAPAFLPEPAYPHDHALAVGPAERARSNVMKEDQFVDNALVSDIIAIIVLD